MCKKYLCIGMLLVSLTVCADQPIRDFFNSSYSSNLSSELDYFYALLEDVVADIVARGDMNDEVVAQILEEIDVHEQAILSFFQVVNPTTCMVSPEILAMLPSLANFIQSIVQNICIKCNDSEMNTFGAVADIDKFLSVLKSGDSNLWNGVEGGLWGYNRFDHLFYITADLLRFDF